MKREPIKMPVLSDTMKTGHLVSWQKQVGDAVKKGDILAEIESDKAIMDLEAFDDGYLAGPLAPADSDIAVGAVIGYLVDSPEAAATEPQESTQNQPEVAKADTAASAPPPKPTTQPAPAPQPERPEPVASATPPKSGRVKASPYARGLAHELGINLDQLKPGDGGVISSREVLAAALQGPQPDLAAGPPCHYQSLTSMQKAVADNMIATVQTPTFSISAEMPIEAVKNAAHSQQISFTLLLARAVAQTIIRHPKFNMVYTRRGLAVRERIDIGIAVDVPDGLVTPVIRDVAGRSMAELAEDWRILRDKTKRQRLVPADYTGATFYISNMGVFPNVHSFEAIVPPGAAAILAVGASKMGKSLMTLSCDHRVLYGADAARFLETLEEHLTLESSFE